MSTHKIISFFTVLLIAIFTLSASHIDKFSHVNMNEVDNLLNSAVLNKEVIGISASVKTFGSLNEVIRFLDLLEMLESQIS